MNTPDIAGLCERLRNFSATWSMYEKHREIPDEAADTIERQAAENKRLRKGLVDIFNIAGGDIISVRVKKRARAALTGE
jgi:hypothetical protein